MIYETETPSGGYDCDENNPCDPANTAENGYYYPHHDEEYFVQCDAWGKCEPFIKKKFLFYALFLFFSICLSFFLSNFGIFYFL